MAVFTTTPKTPLSWPAPAINTTEYFLKINDTNFLIIGETFKLVINRGNRDETVWTNRNKYT